MIPAEIKSWNGAANAISSVWVADSLRGRFVRGAVWSLVGALIAQGANLAASVITARLLGREQFGQYGMIQSTVGMLGIFAGLGLGVTATKYVAEFRISDPARAGRIIALGCTIAIMSGGLLALALLAFAPLLAAKTLNAPTLGYELRIASILLFFTALNGAQTGALSGFEAFRSIARINLLRGLVTFPVTVAGVILLGLPGAIWASALTAAITCVFIQISLRQQCTSQGIQPRFSSAWRESRVLWTFSTPAFVSAALAGPAIWAANTMLVNQPGGYSEMGMYGAASQWRAAISFVPGVVAQFALPLLSNLNGQRESSRYSKALRWNLILTAAAAMSVAVPVVIAAPYIMGLYGKTFQQGSLILVLSAATAVITSINNVVGTAILSAGSVWIGCAFNGMWAAVLLVCCYSFIPSGLALGLTWSILVAYLAHTVWQALYLRYRLSAESRPQSPRT